MSPLLAVAEHIKQSHHKAKFLLVGTRQGPERAMAQAAGIPFVAIFAGKFRRYLSLKNLVSPFEIALGFFQSFTILKSFRPDCVFGAGAFVQVPVVWAAWFLRIPVVMHQQDVQAGLANRLSQYTAKKITVVFEETAKNFVSGLGIFYEAKKNKVAWTGNAVRKSFSTVNKKQAILELELSGELPVLAVIGGGTGAVAINELIQTSLPELTKIVEIIHITGKSKNFYKPSKNYHPYEFMPNAEMAFAAADIVLTRAGIGTISELSYMGKPAIIIPMPDSHQEENAFYVASRGAAVVLSQKYISSEGLVRVVRKMLIDGDLQERLKKHMGELMPKNGTEQISNIVLSVAEGGL